MNKEEQVKFIEDNYPATTHHTSKRKIRHTFFKEIKTEIQSYLLGFYAADGSIDEKRKTLRIELLKKDVEIIRLFKNFISEEARIYKTKEREFVGPRDKIIHAHGSIGIDITSAELCNSLVNLGFGYRKSWKELHLPNISDKLMKHFIRGYFDGDGTISGYLQKAHHGKNERFRYYFSLIAKEVSILIDIQKFFANNGINISINYTKRDDMYYLKTSDTWKIKQIYDLLYNDSNFYLTRKFNKFNHYVNTENLQLIAEVRNALEMSVKESNNSPTSTGHPILLDENIC